MWMVGCAGTCKHDHMSVNQVKCVVVNDWVCEYLQAWTHECVQLCVGVDDGVCEYL